jgi:hypothetical protein
MLDIVATITTSILPFEGNHTFFNQLLHQVFLMSVLYGVGEGVKFFCLMSKFVFLFELLSCYIIVVNSLGHLCLVCVCVFTNWKSTMLIRTKLIYSRKIQTLFWMFNYAHFGTYPSQS